jgi:DNA-binding PadR family transcriptional regulator
LKVMSEEEDEKRLQAGTRRMGEPSWLVLRVLDPHRGIPGIEILRRVDDVLEAAGYPMRRLEPSTLHYALKRMEEDGFVRATGPVEVDVPGPRGSSRRAPRLVYQLTGLGAMALERRRTVDALADRAGAGEGIGFGDLVPSTGASR